MVMGIYKPGQGYWTRMMTAIAAGVLVLMGAGWVWNSMAAVRIGSLETVYAQAAAAVLVVAVFGSISYYLVAVKLKVVDFLIATEGEMKKVNWSTRREIMGSTWLVIGLTFVIAVIIGVLDRIYYLVFQAAGILEGGA